PSGESPIRQGAPDGPPRPAGGRPVVRPGALEVSDRGRRPGRGQRLLVAGIGRPRRGPGRAGGRLAGDLRPGTHICNTCMCSSSGQENTGIVYPPAPPPFSISPVV